LGELNALKLNRSFPLLSDCQNFIPDMYAFLSRRWRVGEDPSYDDVLSVHTQNDTNAGSLVAWHFSGMGGSGKP